MEEDWEGADRFTQLSKIMSKDLMVIPSSFSARQAFDLLTEKNRRLAPVVTKAINDLIAGSGVSSSKVFAEFGIRYLFLANPINEELVRTIH